MTYQIPPISVSIYILCYNEELMLPFAINWYKTRFPNAEITILDNHSTDRSSQIARELGCQEYLFATENKISDLMYQYLKNNHWKRSKSNWILCCDVDELLEINEDHLRNEENQGTTIIKGEAYNMVNMNDDLNIAGIDHGYRDNEVCQLYDKVILFNKNYISDINYKIGAHGCVPDGATRYNKNRYILRHYKYINADYMVARHKMYAERLSEENLANNWGANYLDGEQSVRDKFAHYRKLARKI